MLHIDSLFNLPASTPDTTAHAPPMQRAHVQHYIAFFKSHFANSILAQEDESIQKTFL